MLYESTLKIAVCDDRAEDRQELLRLLTRYLDEKEILAEIDTFESGNEFLKSNTSKYLLVFMDICMKELNGLDTAELLLKSNPRAQVVFSSASREYAVEAYQMEALHYLLKPLEASSLYRVMDKFFESYSHVCTITVKVGRAKEDIYQEDLIWVEADGKRSILHTKMGVLMVSNPLAQLQEMLPSAQFFRPIRWAVISLGEVRLMGADQVMMSDGTEIPISRAERARAKLAYADYRWKRMRQRT